MTSLACYLGEDRKQKHASTAGIQHTTLAAICAAMFQSLPRSDQRRKGAEYVYGLLAADGRKSIRNMAALFGGRAAEQRLHHFVCSSTWDWVPVRHALSQFMVRLAPPQAWVVRPMIIPKAGDHSVGVDRRFLSDMGHVVNAQQAIGVWAASEELRTPLNWRLRLSPAWIEDKERRAQAAIPDGFISKSIGDGAVDAFLQMTACGGLPVRPIILDGRDLDIANTVGTLREAGVPFLVRLSGAVRLAVTDSALTGHHADVLPAHHIMRAARHLRRPAVWRGGADAMPHTCLVAGVQVRLPGDAAPASLLATAEIGEDWPGQLWLTNLTTCDTAALIRLTRLMARVDEDFEEIADEVGLRDFVGRSFGGWHRHITLASAAYAVSVLTQRENAAVDHVS